MWPKLRRCFDYAEVELSNNLAENSIRPVTLGRKNWLHVGSVKAAPKVAAILSVVESCRRLGVPLKDYLLDIQPGLDRRKVNEIPQFSRAAGLQTASDPPGRRQHEPSDTGSNAECDPARRCPWNRQRGALDSC